MSRKLKKHRETAVRGEDETTQLRGISLIRPMFYSTIDHNELCIAIGLQGKYELLPSINFE